MKKLTSIVFYLFLIMNTGIAQIDYNGPESVVYDSVKDRYLITSCNSHKIFSIDLKSGNDSLFAESNDCMGNDIMGDIMFVSSNDKLQAFDLLEDNLLWEITITGANFLDGITHDPEGNLYLVDVSRNKVFKVDTTTKQSEEFVSSFPFSYPQDIVFDHIQNRLVLAAWATSYAVVEIDITSAEVTIISDCEATKLDGIAIDNDGNFYLSSHSNGGQVLKYNNNFSSEPEIISEDHSAPAGLCIDEINNLIIIPNYDGNTVDYLSTINRMDGIEDVAYDKQDDSYYITNALGGDILKVDSRANQFVVASRYKYPTGILLYDNTLVYAINSQVENSSDFAKIIGVNKNTFEQYFSIEITESDTLLHMDRNQETGLIYITDKSGMIFEIDITTSSYQTFVDANDVLLDEPSSVLVDAENNRLIAFSWLTEGVNTIDFNTQEINKIANVGFSQTVSSTMDTYGNIFYVSREDNKVHMIDPNLVFKPIEISDQLSQPIGMCINENLDSLIICDNNTNSLLSIKLHYIDTLISTGETISFYDQSIDTIGIYSHIIKNSNITDTYILNVSYKDITHNGETDDMSKSDNLFRIWPNPVTDYLKIAIKSNDLHYLQLFDITGRILLAKYTQENTEIIDMIDLETGVYLLKLSSKNYQKTCKILVNH